MEELDIKTAIQIAKILAAAPDERIPMILDVFSKAQVDINGLDELAEWRALDKQAALIDTDTFVTELTKGKELEDGEYRIRVPEFNHFCSTKGVSARYARKHLYESGMLRSSTDTVSYTHLHVAFRAGAWLRGLYSSYRPSIPSWYIFLQISGNALAMPGI